jgi:F-type H+-transporting ATPase subunit b
MRSGGWCLLALALACWILPGQATAHPGEGEHAEGHDHDEDHGQGHGHGAEGHGHDEHAASGSPKPLKVDPDLAIWTAVVFLVLLAILGKFAWGPIVAALEAREQGIADNIAAAAAQHEEAKRLLAEYDVKLASAADQVRELLEEARRDAEHTKSEILAEAKAAAGAEHDRAMREVSNAKDAALKEIGEAASGFAIELAGKIVQREVTADDHTRLIREAVSQFPSKN